MELEAIATKEVIIDGGPKRGMQADQVHEEGYPEGQSTTDGTGEAQFLVEENVHESIPLLLG